MRAFGANIGRRAVSLLAVLAALIFCAASAPARADFVQQGAKLVGTGAVGRALQGAAVALSRNGSTAIVGGPQNNTGVGTVWIYVRSGGGWVQQGGRLVGTGAIGRAEQGGSVALSKDGNTAIVGGQRDNNDVGAAWIFVRDGGGVWQQQAKLVGNDATAGARLGTSVALSWDGNTAIVGGANDNSNAGAAWVFVRSGNSWTQSGSKLVGTGATGFAYQGASVALSDDGATAAVGGYGDNTYVGATWIYVRSGGSWTQQGSKLTASDYTGATPRQGRSVALSDNGDRLVVGGPGDNADTGAVWIFNRTLGSWTQDGGKLVGVGGTGSHQYQGHSVAISSDGKNVIAGAHFADTGTGAAWAYVNNGVAWQADGGKISAGDATGNLFPSEMGISAALAGDGYTAIFGGYTDRSATGAAFLFGRVPTVTAVSPNHGSPGGGTPVTIEGFGFTGTTVVKFGGIAVTPDAVFPTTINATTPAHDGGPVDVTVTNAAGTGTGAAAFTYDGPFITSLSPSAGPVAGGTPVVIAGQLTGATGVTFDGVAGTSFIPVSDNLVTVTTPARTGAGPVAVVVQTAGGDATRTAGYTYFAPPTITSVAPDRGPINGGASVVISGTNLIGTTSVQFDATPAVSFVVNSATQITAVTPAHAIGPAAVSVTTPGGTASGNLYTYMQLTPTIVSVSPNKGPLNGGGSVTISGTNFFAVSAVKFGATKATTFTVNGTTTITAKAPAHAAGAVAVSVTAADGLASANSAFHYIAAPTIATVSPDAGPKAGGTNVTITGTDLTATTAVRFGNSAAAAYHVKNATTIVAKTPAHAAGPVAVSVISPGGSWIKVDAFTFYDLPTITSINPNTGPAEGGTRVSIIGTNLTGATAVNFGTSAARSFSVASASSATATVPPHAAGPVHVTVTAPGGTSATSAHNAFTYTPTPKLMPLAKFVGGKNDGGKPYGWLIADNKGVLYGTTLIGGASNLGTVFSLTPGKSATAAWTKTILHSFGGADGATPYAGLASGANGELYGTTYRGGAHNKGAIYKLTPPNYDLTVLYSFNGGATDGGFPYAGVALDSGGLLFGTTTTGGAKGYGTAFKLTPGKTTTDPWTLAVLHHFAGVSDGATAKGTFVFDKKHNLYGSASNGGVSNNGSIFRMTRGGATTVLHRFAATGDGGDPSGGLLVGANNVLYGTTSRGGTQGRGAVFKLTPPSTVDKLLYSFTGTTGANPYGSLVADTNNVLYGTTLNGGANGNGTVFKLLPPANGQAAWNESVMYSFKGAADGANPYSAVLLGKNGVLYGTASAGGGGACSGGCGLIFMIKY